jgi:hypothetical protein
MQMHSQDEASQKDLNLKPVQFLRVAPLPSRGARQSRRLYLITEHVLSHILDWE